MVINFSLTIFSICRIQGTDFSIGNRNLSRLSTTLSRLLLSIVTLAPSRNDLFNFTIFSLIKMGVPITGSINVNPRRVFIIIETKNT